MIKIQQTSFCCFAFKIVGLHFYVSREVMFNGIQAQLRLQRTTKGISVQTLPSPLKPFN